jgi:NAD(P)H-hydrate epimerase
MLTREQVREVDRRAIEELGMPGLILMENAGRGVAELLIRLGVHGRVAICCGKGNNGGDGFVAARHLDMLHAPVRVLLFARPEELTGDAATNYHIIARAGLPITVYAGSTWDREALKLDLTTSEWIVDALFGTGLVGPVRPPFDEIIQSINRAAARILAVDIPSGLNCDTGEPMGTTIRAERTATLVALKKGFAMPAAQPWLGKVHLIDIGLPRAFLERVITRSPAGGESRS